MVAPGSVPTLAQLLDPEAPLVYLELFRPLSGMYPGDVWTDVSLPLSHSLPNELLRARSISFDVLLPTPRFLALAPALKKYGLYCAQVEHAPPSGLRLDQLDHPAARKNWYRKAGFILSFDLPHEGEVAQVAACSSAVRTAALDRLDRATRRQAP